MEAPDKATLKEADEDFDTLPVEVTGQLRPIKLVMPSLPSPSEGRKTRCVRTTLKKLVTLMGVPRVAGNGIVQTFSPIERSYIKQLIQSMEGK